MNLAFGVLARNEIRPGWSVLHDNVPMGKEYVLDLDKVNLGRIENQETGDTEKVILVLATTPESYGWLPIFIFDFPGHEKYDSHLKGSAWKNNN